VTVFNLFNSVDFSLLTHLRNYCFFNAPQILKTDIFCMNIIKQLIAGTEEGVDGFLSGASPFFSGRPKKGDKKNVKERPESASSSLDADFVGLKQTALFYFQSINQSINFIYPRIYSVALKC